MVGGEKAGGKRNSRKRIKFGEGGSDDSDEDNVISEEETDASEDTLADLDGSALDEDEIEDEVEEEEVEEEGYDSGKLTSGPTSSHGMKDNNKSLPRNGAFFQKYDEDDEDEFDPEGEDDIDCLEDEEDLAEKKRTGSEITTYRNTSTSKASHKSTRRNKRSKISRKGLKKRGTEQVVVRRKSISDNDDAGDDTGNFFKDSTWWRRLGIKYTQRRKRRCFASSDSDFVTSGSSDCEYTISEEEREPVREANDFCGSLAPCTRNSSSSKRSVTRRNLSVRSSYSCNRTGEGDNVANQSKPTGTRGKEKMEESNVVKQVCGICLSEEDKRKVRGTLDCCSHYFCFTCIREWSKVESRCPLCKQRFHTIIKQRRLRDEVIPVPERDQVQCFCRLIWFFRCASL